ncbi:MAG: pilus assembly protein CpaC [Hyphomonadaceae bacterium]|uniref:type II and III secretion system protein family protein n=1 Tax=Henriciella sp. TaxID=1968823 RepID=UPI000C117683|nr:type II and III secretion system protein family protein [Henriciella sp.]MBF34824.1 pilus assembly protein CpaC [Hyphomonadaceae bacterium]PHR76792.1 MAG: pilus assembly protein CpaC [Henriciella sp.]|tara:strand:+ start:1809 stop:3236 length:1428 start_codon:yes stop_codon:yes gene_type:complete
MSALWRTLIAACAAGLLHAPVPAGAQNLMGVSIMEPGETNVSQTIRLGLNKSTVIELDRPVADVVITNPEIADAVVQTAQRLIFRGIEVGETNAFLFDRAGQPILNLEILVNADTAALERLVERYVPGARVSVESVGGNMVVSGNVDNIVQSDQIMRLIRAYSGDDELEPVNMLSVAAKDQVMLEVRIVEMQRSLVKQLGIDINAQRSGNPEDVVNFDLSSATALAVQGGALGGLGFDPSYTTTDADGRRTTIGASIDALERVGIVRTLAEPNISAISGESAKFLAGGEFPVPTGQDENGRVTIEFKPYGVGLGFTPVVLSEGRISLKVSTEVSELTTQGAFQAAGSLSIPALTVRRAESTVELPSGGSMMLAGLIQSRSRQSLDQLPGLKRLPVLGALFQSRDFLNEETELVVIITPYLVDPTSKNNLRTPADGFANASDAQTIFFGALNAQYGRDGQGLSRENYNAPVGFIEE